MSRKQRYYSPEFRQQALELLEASGKPAAAIERDLGITEGLLSRWKRKAAGNRPNAVTEEGEKNGMDWKKRVRELERENALLRQERDILKKTVVIFSSSPNR